MNFKLKALKNVGSNWLGALLTLLVGFFLSPFILHKLGDEAFGVWILIFSITGYYGIFDFGIRSTIIKYVAECKATGDDDRFMRIVNLSTLVYSCVAFGIIVIVAVGSRYFNSIFHISGDLRHAAKLLFLLVGSAVALGLPLSVFAGILEGLQEFYFINVTQAIVTLLRVSLIILALNHGFGLISVALITALLPLFSSVIYAWKVRRAIALQFGARFIDRDTLKQIFHYSFFAFISVLAFRLRYQTDAIIIGAMLSSSAITQFSIGSKLITYSFMLVTGLGQIFTPMSSQFNAIGDQKRLQKLLVLGNRACALVVLPIATMLVVLGKQIIDVWVGSRYESSYVILIVLLIPSILAEIQGSSRQILYGIGRHKALAIVNIFEGVINVVLSVLFVRYWGIVGDALGTAIPLTLTSTFFLPLYLCRLLKVRIRDYLQEAYVFPIIFCIPLMTTLLLIKHVFHPSIYIQLATQLALGCLVYGICIIWLFLTQEPMGVELQPKFRKYVLQVFGR